MLAAQFGAQRGQRAAHQVRRQVGDQADGVRQLSSPRTRRRPCSRRAGRSPGPGCARRHAQDPGLQELALAGAGGAADQRVRAVLAQVEAEVLVPVDPTSACRVAGCPDERAVLADCEVIDSLEIHCRATTFGSAAKPLRQAQIVHRAGQIGYVLDRRADVDDRRQQQRDLLGIGDVDGLAATGKVCRWRTSPTVEPSCSLSTRTNVRHAAGRPLTWVATQMICTPTAAPRSASRVNRDRSMGAVSSTSTMTAGSTSVREPARFVADRAECVGPDCCLLGNAGA